MIPAQYGLHPIYCQQSAAKTQDASPAFTLVLDTVVKHVRKDLGFDDAPGAGRAR
jgi:hypothetical protein